MKKPVIFIVLTAILAFSCKDAEGLTPLIEMT